MTAERLAILAAYFWHCSSSHANICSNVTFDKCGGVSYRLYFRSTENRGKRKSKTLSNIRYIYMQYIISNRGSNNHEGNETYIYFLLYCGTSVD